MSGFFRGVRNLFVYCMCLCLLCGCGDPPGDIPRVDVAASPKISDSFHVETSTDGSPKIWIRKAALEKEFLFQGNLIMQHFPPIGQAIRSRIVSFRKHGGKLYMLEATQGHTVTRDLPQSFLLAEFPILEENPEGIAFDFNAGMRNIFIADDYWARDYQGTDYKPDFKALKGGFSYLESAGLHLKNQLAISQLVQLSVSFGFLEDNSTIGVKYYLSPYQPDPGFEPTLSTTLDRVGFFEVAPELGLDGNTRIHAVKLNSRKPIVFAISSNTPGEYREAVREGTLYWNHIPESPIRVIDAPEGVVAPDMNYNVIQWIPWDQGGFARADFQMDPRTGEVLHAQVYVTSGFAFYGKNQVRSFLKKEKTKRIADPLGIMKRISLRGFENTELCDLDADEALAGFPQELPATPADIEDKTLLRVSQDYVRSVVAHEIGHVVGLRHNFSSSLQAQNYGLAHRREIFQEYLKSGKVPGGILPASSVMDYFLVEEGALLGNLITQRGVVLPYDEKAIRTLYNHEQFAAKDIPLFCTDSHLRQFVDCEKYDAGGSAIEFSQWDIDRKLKNLPYMLIEEYATAKMEVSNAGTSSIEEVNFDPERVAEDILSSRSALVTHFGKNSGFLKVRREFPFVGPLNFEKVRERELGYFMGEVQAHGGMERVFALVPSRYSSETFERFRALLESGLYATGVNSEGWSYHLMDKEIEVMLATTKILLEKLPTALAILDLKIWNDTPEEWKITETPLGDELATMLGKRLEEYVFATSGNSLEAEFDVPVIEESDGKILVQPKTKRKKVTLPVFAYPVEVRQAAAQLLKSSKGEGIDWGVHERALYKDRFTKLIKDALECSIDKLDVGKIGVVEPKHMRRPVTRWILQNREVWNHFSG